MSSCVQLTFGTLCPADVGQSIEHAVVVEPTTLNGYIGGRREEERGREQKRERERRREGGREGER